MRKILTAAAAALTCAASLGATATTADAAPWHGGGFHGGNSSWHGGNRGGRGFGYLGAGLAGLAIGAAIANRPYYGGYGYPGYSNYGPGYYGDEQCVGTRRVWDPYVGGYVLRRVYYAC
jgi:hypothetical protein